MNVFRYSIRLFIAVLCVLLFPLSIFAEHHKKDDFHNKWIKAEKLLKQAASVGYEWRDTEKILSNAKQAHKNGESQKARYLLDQAIAQSEASIAQEKRESELWRDRVLRSPQD